MPSPSLNFRINQEAYDELLKRATKEDKMKPSKIAQRLLTKLLTGSDDLNLLPPGRPPVDDSNVPYWE